ncbi:MAG: glycosyltransferase family 2 protein [Bryobacteraceae bacterium]
MKDLSIIYVNWNAMLYLHDSLTCLYANTAQLDFEVIVVDNASSDGGLDVLKRDFPEVIFIKSDRNLGFARANNLGYAHSSGALLLFLNPDTLVLGRAVNTMVERLRALPNAAIAGCRLLNSDLSVQKSCIQRFPTILNQVLDLEWLRVRWPKWSVWGTEPLFGGSGGPDEVEVVSGACLLITRQAFEKVGGFSPEYFMYGDDVDLCYKIRHVGLKTYFVGDASVVHYGGGSSRQCSVSQWSAIMQKKATLTFCMKTHGSLYARIYRVAMAGAALCRLALLLGGCFIQRMAGEPKGFETTFGKWAAIFRWAVGLDRSADWLN